MNASYKMEWACRMSGSVRRHINDVRVPSVSCRCIAEVQADKIGDVD